MVSYDDKIQEIEALIKKTKYNKRTQAAIGLYKAQLAQIRQKDEARRSSKGGGQGYQVRKTGDGTVILLGFPSAGKSTLLNGLTDAKSEVAAYAFTTLDVVPGVLKHKHAKIQILDVPGVVKGAASGRGRGKEVLACMHAADMCLILLDGTKSKQLEVLRKEIHDANIRLGQVKPDVRIRKMSRGGIRIGRTVKTPDLTDETIKKILQEFRTSNAEVLIRSVVDADQFIDIVEGNKTYMKWMLVANKADIMTDSQRRNIKKLKPSAVISAQNREDVASLKDLIYKRLDLMPIFLKEPGKQADMDVPLIMFTQATIRNVCEKLHRDFVSKFKYARVTGKSAKFPGQKLSLNHVLKEGDVLELHIK